MKLATASFDGVAADFYEYEQTVRGAVRYDLVQENLARHLYGLPRGIIDFYGGSGPDTAWAASCGHSVLLLESSAEQLEIANSVRFPKLDIAARERIKTSPGHISDLTTDLYESFDAGFSHGVAMYLEDPEAYWEQCLQFIKSGGIFSILEKGFGGTALRLARENKIPELISFLPTRHLAKNNMDRAVRAFTFSELIKISEKLGCKVIDRAGIRIVTEQMKQPRSDLCDEEWDMWLKEERRLSRDIQEMHGAQMLQLIIQKK